MGSFTRQEYDSVAVLGLCGFGCNDDRICRLVDPPPSLCPPVVFAVHVQIQKRPSLHGDKRGTCSNRNIRYILHQCPKEKTQFNWNIIFHRFYIFKKRRCVKFSKQIIVLYR